MNVQQNILSKFPFFKKVEKKADLVTTLAGHEIRVIIQKNEIKGIKMDGNKVWTEGDGEEYLETLIESVNHPAEVLEVFLPAGEGDGESFNDEANLGGEAEVLSELAKLREETEERMQTIQSREDISLKELLADVSFDDRVVWLTRKAQEVPSLRPGDSIHFRVATSNLKPVSMAVDIYRHGNKIATGGREHKIGWRNGTLQAWMDKVDEAVKRAYSMMHLFRMPG